MAMTEVDYSQEDGYYVLETKIPGKSTGYVLNYIPEWEVWSVQGFYEGLTWFEEYIPMGYLEL